jgi:hypothetical protein
MPEFDVAPGKGPEYQTGVLRMMRTLPLVFSAGAQA